MSNTDTLDGNSGFRTLEHLAPRPPAPKPLPDVSEYPKMLQHPECVEANPDKHHGKIIQTNALFGGVRVERWIEPGNPGKFPPLIVNDEEEEAAAIAQGYVSPLWNEAAAKAAHNPPQVPDNYSATQYPKYIAAHDKIVNSYTEELALLPPAERAAREVERAARRPMLADYNNDVEAFSPALVSWALAQQAKLAAYTPSQARAAAHVSESRWTSLIAGGWLAEADKCDPAAITRAVLARDAVDTGIVNS